MLKVRLIGTNEEIYIFEEMLYAVQHYNDNFKIMSLSEPYKNRGISEYSRVYVEIDLKEKTKK